MYRTVTWLVLSRSFLTRPLFLTEVYCVNHRNRRWPNAESFVDFVLISFRCADSIIWILWEKTSWFGSQISNLYLWFSDIFPTCLCSRAVALRWSRTKWQFAVFYTFDKSSVRFMFLVSPCFFLLILPCFYPVFIC